MVPSAPIAGAEAKPNGIPCAVLLRMLATLPKQMVPSALIAGTQPSLLAYNPACRRG